MTGAGEEARIDAAIDEARHRKPRERGMTRRVFLAAVVGNSTAALDAAGPGTAVAVLLLAGWLREHGLRTGRSVA